MSSKEKLQRAIIFPGFGWSSGQKIKQMQFLKRKFEKPIICTKLDYNIVFVRLHICRKIQRAYTSFQTDDSYLDIIHVEMYSIKGFIQKIS